MPLKRISDLPPAGTPPYSGASLLEVSVPTGASPPYTSRQVLMSDLLSGYLTGNQTITLSGDVTGSGTIAIAATLATVNANIGTFQGLTVNAKGLVTAATNQNYAPLASPVFTGDPKAPTPATADNDTSIATTAFVKAQGYAPLASPAFTGAVTVGTNLYFAGVTSGNGPKMTGDVNNIAWQTGTGNGTYTWYNNSGAQLAFIGNGGLQVSVGNAYKPGGGLWGDSSDIRTKEDVADYTRGLDAVVQLRPVSFRHNGKGGTIADGRTFIGLIANEAKDVMPEMVGVTQEKLDKEDDHLTELLTLDATALIYALANAVKELSARVAALEAGRP
jgi:hypothetical protein